tara:strand:- start:85 stop:216 length:132 start_codon:yes stop_codon:yes gene_type:complete
MGLMKPWIWMFLSIKNIPPKKKQKKTILIIKNKKNKKKTKTGS